MPRLSACVSTRPSSEPGGHPIRPARPGRAGRDSLPASGSVESPRQTLRNRVALAIGSRDQLARLAAEAGLDQGGLQSRSRSPARRRGARSRASRSGRSGRRRRARRARRLSSSSVELLQPQDSLAAALDVEQRLALPEHHVGARRCGRAGAGPRASARRGSRRMGSRGRSRRGPAASPSVRGRLRRRSTAPGRANWAPPSPSTK